MDNSYSFSCSRSAALTAKCDACEECKLRAAKTAAAALLSEALGKYGTPNEFGWRKSVQERVYNESVLLGFSDDGDV